MGLGIEMPEPLRPREVVRICTASDYVFAIVQHCTSIAEGRYSVGVVRIDQWHPVEDRKPDLESLRQDAPVNVDAVPKPRLDLGDLQTHAIKELFQQSPDKAQRTARKKARKEKSSGDAVARLQAASGETDASSKQSESSEAAAETPAGPENPKDAGAKPTQLPKKSVGRAKVIGAGVGVVLLLLLLGGFGSGFRYGLGQPAVAESTPETANADVADAPDATTDLDASTDPNATETEESDSTADSELTAETSDSADEMEEEVIVAQSNPAVPAQAATTTAATQRTPAQPVAAPQPAPPQTATTSRPATGGAKHTVQVRSAGPSWVTVCIDHAKVFEGLMDNGDSREFSYRDQMLLRSGNIGALSVSRDSEAVKTSNVVGTIAAWEFTATGAQPTNVEATRSCK